jgi:hypothetical protein
MRNRLVPFCLLFIGDTCSATDQRVRSAVARKDLVAASYGFVGGDACQCDYGFHSPGTTCTYSIGNNQVTFVSPPDPFEAGAFDYCIQGDILSLFVAPTSAAGRACSGCEAVYVFTRPH